MRVKKIGAGSLAIALALPLLGVSMANEPERPIWVKLAGSPKAPTIGDPSGSGEATITIDAGREEICFSLSVSNIGTPTAAGIHEGLAGVVGPALVTLPAPAAGSSSGCVSVSRGIIDRIRKLPSDFYVTVENAEFPEGAIRGQLDE